MSAKSATLKNQIRIASPCSARWEDMAGDDQSRFCGHCSKNVYNFSAMTPKAVQELIEQREGRLCARFHQRADGTILTANCAVGAHRIVQRIRYLLASAAAVLGLSFGVVGAAGGSGDNSSAPSPQKAVRHKIKQLVGSPRIMAQPLMGDVAVAPIRTNSTPAPTNTPVILMGKICVKPPS